MHTIHTIGISHNRTPGNRTPVYLYDSYRVLLERGISTPKAEQRGALAQGLALPAGSGVHLYDYSHDYA